MTYAPASIPPTAPDGGWLCGSDMTHLTAMAAAQALDRITEWQTALSVENKAPGTVALYGDGATHHDHQTLRRPGDPTRR